MRHGNDLNRELNRIRDNLRKYDLFATQLIR